MTNVTEVLEYLLGTLEISPVVTDKEIEEINGLLGSDKVAEVRKNRNLVVQITSEQKTTYRESGEPLLYDQWHNVMSKVTCVLDQTLEQPQYKTQLESCEITKTLGDKVFYLGTMFVNGKKVEIEFNRKGEGRFSVSGYTIEGEKQKGSNIITYLNDEGLLPTRKQLLEGFVLLTA